MGGSMNIDPYERPAQKDASDQAIDRYTIRELLLEMETLNKSALLRQVYSDPNRNYQATAAYYEPPHRE